MYRKTSQNARAGRRPGRIIGLTAAGLLGLGLVACGDDDDSPSPANVDQAPATTAPGNSVASGATVDPQTGGGSGDDNADDRDDGNDDGNDDNADDGNDDADDGNDDADDGNDDADDDANDG